MSREATAWWAAADDEGLAVVVGGAVVVWAEARISMALRASKIKRVRGEDMACGAGAAR